MLWLTEDAVLICDHGGRVENKPIQDWVHIEDRQVLVEDNPEHRDIKHCPNTNPVVGLRACLNTLAVREGYSALVRINGDPVCLDTVRGLTDGSPPGIVNYKVVKPGQPFVTADA
ncbi:hypothetical protein [Inquilinus sp.]|jgi:hypothetical protein|uniref:hypothetical protein n=1 Tax=Inquilinus sp. TaxID=1932117 RepID=UPI0037851AF1